MKRNNWKLELSLAEATKNDELVAIGENEVVRFIDELSGRNSESIYSEIAHNRKQIKYLKRQDKDLKTRRSIESLYAENDGLLFLPEYLSLQIDSEKDFKRACEGFSLNGLVYRRLVGTTGGIKESTVVFVAEKNKDGIIIRDNLLEKIENGRNKTVPLVPAKFEAYRALSCSASRLVSQPTGVIVVNDCITKFKTDYILLDDEADGEPKLSEVDDGEIELNCSDGFGFISPDLARQWSDDLGEESLISGFCIRNSFCKGMLFPFDYIDFGEKIAKNYIIIDAWGVKRDVRNAEVILTTSMLKLWDSYESIEDYLSNCEKNGYKFCVTKTCEPRERNRRELNYQFLQSYKFSDEDIIQLLHPSLEDLSGIMGGDYYKTLLYLKGDTGDDAFADYNEYGFAEALMVNNAVSDDPCLRSRVMQMVSKKINQTKLGRLSVIGDFHVISGDPYSLCQSMFGLEIQGLIGAGEVYSRYWVKRGADEVVCFRAPMSCHNNIRKVKVYHDDKTDYWYRYMDNVLILNSWDTVTMATNGADCDGDSFLSTNNPVLLRNTLNLRTISCIQRKASKTLITEENLIQSNIDGMGDQIGAITNRITAMFEVKVKFPEDSNEYKALEYRIMCGQLYQQNAINKMVAPCSNVWC